MIDTKAKIKTEFSGLFQGLTKIGKLFIELIVKRNHKSTKTDININRKHSATSNIALIISKDISENNYGAISTSKKKE